MKVSFYFAFNKIRRRPRRFISFVLVFVSILTVLNLMLFYLEADWRQRVMPESPTSYHFTVRTTDDYSTIRDYLDAQPWVQKYYVDDIYSVYDENLSYFEYFEFDIRVDWDNVLRVGAVAAEMFEELDLWSSPYYAEKYELRYNIVLGQMKTAHLGATHINGVPIEVAAVSRAKAYYIENNVVNHSFCNLTINNYIIRPEFAMYMSLFSIFLGSAIVILFSEQYRGDMKEFGTLRALGLKKWQLMAINCIENIAVSLRSIPISILASAVLVCVYSLATQTFDDSTAYLNLTSNLPLGAMVIVALMLTAVSLIGCIAVCVFYRERTAMDMLRGVETLRVSFVSKTSPHFDSATSLNIYDRLYLLRTRISVLLGALVIALMMPLPLYYLSLIVRFIGVQLSEGELLVAVYHITQAVMLFITSAAVTLTSTRSAVDSRHSELSVLRALGTHKKRIRKSAFTVPLLQALVIFVLASILFISITDTSVTVSSIPSPKVDASERAAITVLSIIGTAILALPPMFIGAAISLKRLFRRSTVDSLRLL